MNRPVTPGWAFPIRDRWLDLSTPQIMGILNLTPDSFSDGGLYHQIDTALKRVEYYCEQGVELIDVGAESSRPGSIPLSADAELKRLLPILEAIRQNFPDVLISVDTYHTQTMVAAVQFGADWINDINALQETPETPHQVAQLGVPVILMHRQDEPVYGDVVADVISFLAARKQACLDAGIPVSKIVLDPGFGFGKLKAHNWTLLRRLSDFSVLNSPLLVGISRKSMFAHLVPGATPSDRAAVSTAAAFFACLQGAHFIRTHDVEWMQSFLALWPDLMASYPTRQTYPPDGKKSAFS